MIPSPKKEWKPSDPKDFVRFVMGESQSIQNKDVRDAFSMFFYECLTKPKICV